MTTNIVEDQHPTNKHDAPTPLPEPDDTKREVSPVRRSAEHAELAKVAEELWRQLARDMKAAREDAGIPASKWGLPSNWDRVSPLEDSQKAGFSRTHLSNVENRRGGAKPTPLIAELYDNWFTRPGDPEYFRRLQEHAAAADDRAKKSKQRAERGASSRPLARNERQLDTSEHAARLQLPQRATGLGLAICTVLALAAFGPRLIGDREELTPPDPAHPAGQRLTCAESMELYKEPRGEHLGKLGPRMKIRIDRYQEGPHGPYTYAHGVTGDKEGWVIEEFLCDGPNDPDLKVILPAGPTPQRPR